MFVDPSELHKDAALMHGVERFGGVDQNTRDRMNRRLYVLMIQELDEDSPDIEKVRDIGNLLMKLDKSTLDWKKQAFAEKGEENQSEEDKVDVGDIVRQLLASDHCDDLYDDALRDAAEEEGDDDPQ